MPMTSTDLTPAERNRLRHLRDLLDLYERNPQAQTAINIGNAAEDLSASAMEAERAREGTRQDAMRAALKEFGG